MRRTLTTLGLIVALSGAGVAFAGWIVPGYSSATVQASDPHLDVTGGEVQGAYPGGTSPTQLNVHNGNAFPVQFGDVALDLVTVDPDHQACPASVLSIAWTNPHVMLLPQDQRTIDVGIVMSPDAPQACVGATFHVVYKATGTVGTT